MAVHRRKQAVTKTNEGGRGGGRARGELRRDGRLDPSASSIPRPADLPPSRRVSTSSHHLSDAGGELMAPARLFFFFFDESVCVGVCRLGLLQVGSSNKHVHLPDFPPQLRDWRKMRKTL